MHTTSTTVVAVVGENARACVDALGNWTNVVARADEPDAPPLDRAVAACAHARRVHAPYFAHDADPLAAVADAWVRYYDEDGPLGELEVVVAETLVRWRARSLDLPDYYVVLDPEQLAPTRRHWYLGLLYAAAPPRVVPAAGMVAAVGEVLGRLRPGRWWPPLPDLLTGIERVVPDHVGPGRVVTSPR